MLTNALFAGYWRTLRAACHDPQAEQARVLRRILASSAHTNVGRRNAWARLARTRDPQALVRGFREGLPIRTHAAMSAELDAVHAGDWRSLCPSPPVFFALTAGSSGTCKRIPVTREFRAELGRGSLAYSGALEQAFPALRRRRLQFLVGSAEGGHSPSGVPVGFVSGFNYRNLPWVLRRRFLLPYWVFTIEDVEERSYAALRLLAGRDDVGALCAISPVNLLNVRETAERNAARLLDDLGRGTLDVRGRSAVTGCFHGPARPELAARLRREWERDGRFSDRTLFPGLEALVCWQGGNMGYHLPELRRAFGGTPTLDFPTSASEGVFAIPFRPGEPGGVVAIQSHFLEFVPEDEGTAGSEALGVHQLEVGRQYRLVVTNSAGLHRYDMEDLVRCRGHLERTPVIEFVSKVDRRVSISNERIHEGDVTEAMSRASAATGTWVREFLFVPCRDGRYRVLLDGRAGLSEARCRRLGEELERQLRAVAFGYDFEREDALLAPLELVVTPPGVLRRHLDARLHATDLPNAQVKPQHLTREFDLHHSLLAEVADAV